MSGSEYARAVAWRLGIFLVLTLLFPLFLQLLAKATGCARISGACGAVGLAGVLYLKPLILLILVGMLVRPSLQRAASAGLVKWYGLLVPAFFLLDWHFFLAWEGYLSLVARLGIKAFAVPYLALAGLLMAGFLTLKSTGDDDDPFVRTAMITLAILTVIVLVLGDALRLFLSVPRSSLVAAACSIGILCILAALIGRELWTRSNSTPTSPPPAPPSRLPPPAQFGKR